MLFLTVEKSFSAETEEKKSRFIAHLVPLPGFDAALEVLRRDHPRAAHHVTAFRAISDDGRIIESAKDDGEPSGTSGMPILKAMQGARLVEAGIVVVRYFGGTKLGTGGLARAYSAAARAAIERADLHPWQRIVRRTIEARFETSSSVENQAVALGLCVVERVFGENGVTLTVEGPEEKVSALSH